MMTSCKTTKNYNSGTYSELSDKYLELKKRYLECQIENSVMLDKLIELGCEK